MISMMNDEDLTDSTQKRLQWDAEDRGYPCRNSVHLKYTLYR